MSCILYLRLKNLLQHKTIINLKSYQVWLQNQQMLEPPKTLIEQCFENYYSIQVNTQILHTLQRINIIDVIKPTEEVLNELIITSNESEREINWVVDREFFEKNRKYNIPSDPLKWSNIYANRGNDRQIVLWQFLLRLLTQPKCRDLIQFVDNGNGKFKLINKDEIAINNK